VAWFVTALHICRLPEPDIILTADEALSIGNVRVSAIATPGHSLDHTSFMVEQASAVALVTGDAMMHSGRIIYQDIYDFDVRQSADSIRRLATFEFDTLLPGHGLLSGPGVGATSRRRSRTWISSRRLGPSTSFHSSRGEPRCRNFKTR